MEKIKKLIQNQGLISIADFINEAMFNPLSGYYSTQKPIGKTSDFITAPEISQVFGELIAAYFLNFILANNKKISLVEMGAGLGTLFYDVLITIDKITKKLNSEELIKKRLKFNIIEISDSLTKIQKEKLKELNFEINWYKNFGDFIKENHDREIYFFANELFDCFPIHQFVKTKFGWQERMLTIIDEELAFTIENFNKLKNEIVEDIIKLQNLDIAKAQENSVFEHSFIARNFIDQLSLAIKKQGGIALIIDYGYLETQFKSTLQAIKNHHYHNLLKDVGKCDITSLVNFGMLKKCAEEHDLNSSITTQREFLLQLGIKERFAKFNSQDQDILALNRLIDEKEMGELFKCLLIWPK